jgi:hypothetical protein
MGVQPWDTSTASSTAQKTNGTVSNKLVSGADSPTLPYRLLQDENHRNAAKTEQRDVPEIIHVRPQTGLLRELEIQQTIGPTQRIGH